MNNETGVNSKQPKENAVNQEVKPNLEGFMKELIGSASVLNGPGISSEGQVEWLRSLMDTYGVHTVEDVQQGVQAIAEGNKTETDIFQQPERGENLTEENKESQKVNKELQQSSDETK